MCYERWMNNVKVGDVLTRGAGRTRVVRNVSRGASGRLHSVAFSIKHCSWTGRCYTVLTYNDLSQLGFRPVGKRIPLRTTLDRAIARELRFENRFKQRLTCCDVSSVR